jgi:DNA-binding GntR family transcriptional regulator
LLKEKMKKQGILNTASLKEQVYEYLRQEIRKRNLAPGSAINMDATSRKLGISKTPLRDALIQLEMEGFVTILPRKGIYVNGLTLQEIKEYYQVIGALESSALSISFSRFNPSNVDRMKKLNEEMKNAIEKNNFNLFYKKNLTFHNVYIDLCGNQWLIQIINTLKKRLYDFVPQEKWIKEWEQSSVKEHDLLVEAIEKDDLQAATSAIHDVHWSFEVQEKFIRRYYFDT